MRSTLAVCSVLLAVTLLGQGDRGTITGEVSDQTGAVVSGAPIEAKHLETGAIYQAASSSTGNFTLSQLPAGVYEISASVPGFKKYVRTGDHRPGRADAADRHSAGSRRHK
jgi:hypothetical protein